MAAVGPGESNERAEVKAMLDAAAAEVKDWTALLQQAGPEALPWWQGRLEAAESIHGILLERWLAMGQPTAPSGGTPTEGAGTRTASQPGLGLVAGALAGGLALVAGAVVSFKPQARSIAADVQSIAADVHQGVRFAIEYAAEKDPAAKTVALRLRGRRNSAAKTAGRLQSSCSPRQLLVGGGLVCVVGLARCVRQRARRATQREAPEAGEPHGQAPTAAPADEADDLRYW